MSKLGIAGRVLCGLFFLCLSFAGVTSMIGYIELTARTIQDFGGWLLHPPLHVNFVMILFEKNFYKLSKADICDYRCTHRELSRGRAFCS